MSLLSIVVFLIILLLLYSYSWKLTRAYYRNETTKTLVIIYAKKGKLYVEHRDKTVDKYTIFINILLDERFNRSGVIYDRLIQINGEYYAKQDN